ncbi:ribosome silencing factor [Candidatus Saganbacteria bacterium]|uniref:Ribosomal silencing factor RsfS n=1 Tax=Candidatus Saganbacteria bacterium TaxID=2575572 RepID=A0A9D6YT45_UNCSA|nr:ribosome silencing factor [Candidatus Saganbacteria bacterium]
MRGKSIPKIVEIVAGAAESKKALDLKVLDVRKTSKVVDWLVICSGESAPQIRAIEKEIEALLRKNKIKGLKREGVMSSGWVILDLGSVVVHIMGVAEREYYRLEELWGKEAVVYHY